MTFEVLRNHEDYEILNEYPHTVRRKSDGRVNSEWFDKQGYVMIKLNQKRYLKHRIIAEQFIENDDPDTKTQVDHINHNRADNRIENLRWVSASDNCKNKSRSSNGIEYTFSDDIPDESLMITDYQTTRGMKYFDDDRYYYVHDDETDEDLFFAKVKDDYYKRLHINLNKNGIRFICLLDINNKRVSLYIDKFKRQYDL